VADRFDLRRDISFGTTVTGARYDEATNRWLVASEDGRSWSARFLILAVGCPSAINRSPLANLGAFRGSTYHTGNWPHGGVSFSGQRVGVIGTGSTGIQAIPLIAEQAEHLYVFQRTPNFSVPARNAPLPAGYPEEVKAHYDERCRIDRKSAAGLPDTPPTQSALEVSTEERQRRFEEAWRIGGGAAMMFSYTDLLTDPRANRTAADFVRGKIAEIVDDAETARRLMPTDHPIAAKRICVDTDYYVTYNRKNVTLVDVRAHPERGDGDRLADRRRHV
jgi:cation diffusion facilitator CzcD-associated flavoprotein CzcO